MSKADQHRRACDRPNASEHGSAREIAALLADRIEQLSESLLGPRNKALSNKLQWRWRSKGSLKVAVSGEHRGDFYDFEAGHGGDALELVKVNLGCNTRAAIKWAIGWLGKPQLRVVPRTVPEAGKPTTLTVDASRTHALSVWDQCVPIRGTIAEVYLKRRAIFDVTGIEDLRFHPSCPVGRSSRLPAMVGLFRNISNDTPVAIHRTFLMPDGSGKLNPEEHNIPAAKMMMGPSKGAAIKLSPDDEVEAGLCIAEGIENAMTLMCRGWRPIWAAGSAGAIGTFPVLNGIEHLTIFPDNDDTGAGMNAARACAERWSSAGKSVTLRVSPKGEDWNDVAMRSAA